MNFIFDILELMYYHPSYILGLKLKAAEYLVFKSIETIHDFSFQYILVYDKTLTKFDVLELNVKLDFLPFLVSLTGSLSSKVSSKIETWG